MANPVKITIFLFFLTKYYIAVSKPIYDLFYIPRFRIYMF